MWWLDGAEKINDVDKRQTEGFNNSFFDNWFMDGQFREYKLI